MSRILKSLLLLALAAGLRAEFLLIEQGAAALDCASCTQSLDTGLRKMKGVEAVEIDQAASMIRVVLQPGNRVRLEAFRDLLKRIGFTPTAARVRVRGKASQDEFQVDGLDQKYRLSKPVPAGEMLVVDGVVPVPPDPRAPPVLEVTGFTASPAASPTNAPPTASTPK